MPSDGGLMRLRTDQSGIIVNEGDSIGDDLEPMPAAIREMRHETIKISQRVFGRGGENQPAKIWARRQTGKAAEETIGNLFEVTGYFTLLKYLFNRTPRDIEGILGLAPQKLSSGADILVIIDELSGDQFAPRYTSAWSAGASPRDLHHHGAKYHPDYPPANTPVYQWVIYRNKPARARKIATLAYNEQFIYHTS
jgi:hypothetical protein